LVAGDMFNKSGNLQ